MTSLATNANNDIYSDDTGNLAVVTGIDACRQDCEHAMKTQLGECVLDLTNGVPTLDTIWLNYRPKPFIAAARALLLTVPNVLAVPSFTITREGNVAEYTATIQTVFGNVAISGALTR